jgi:hypothetical protein
MAGLVLALLVLQVGNPAPGVVTGTVRSADGKPAANVRVYGQEARNGTDADSVSAPLEGLTQTDVAGRYRLELPPGRYHIATGSVSAPTFYPGTTSLAAARVITVVSGELIEGIDFGSFVPVSRPTGSPAVYIEGSVRYPDGTPVAGVTVAAVFSVAALTPAATQAQVHRSVTGVAGNYRIPQVPTGAYHVFAGFREAPTFYPAVSKAADATSVTVARTTVGAIDIVMPYPVAPSGMTVRGSVTSKDGIPAPGSTVRIRRTEAAGGQNRVASSLPSMYVVPDALVAPDGTFEFSNVVPGSYLAQAFLGSANQYQSLDVGDSPVQGLRFTLPATALTGRILMSDGSPLPDSQLFDAAAIATVDNPNIVRYSIFPISSAGTFASLPEKGEYRFFLRTMPEEYEIRSITAGAVDLMKETFKPDSEKSIVVEVRVARRVVSSSPNTLRVVGSVLDSVSGSASPASRVRLCCLDSGLYEALSAPLRPDGSFEFLGVPPGRYTPELKVTAGVGALRVFQSTVKTGPDAARVELLSIPAASTTQPLAGPLPSITIEPPIVLR